MARSRPIFYPRTYCLLLSCSIALSTPLLAQTPPLRTPEGVSASQPFSAVKFTRKVHIESDGTPTILTERRDIHLARNANGRVFLADGTEGDSNPCNLPEPNPPEPIKLPKSGLPPLCDNWGLLVFDPNAGIFWHWGDGIVADKTQYVEIDLTSGQARDAERSMSTLPVIHIEEPEPTVTMNDLGVQNIEGIPARGVRTVTLHKDAATLSKVTIHEIWISTQMSLVLKIIDGDPAGDETITGLDHISLTPDPQLFQPPTERILRHYKDGRFADYDFRQLAKWLVQ
jgi:hypothetical protein